MVRCKSVVLIITLYVLLGGCATYEVGNYFPPIGSEVILKQELNTRGARVFIQNGQVTTSRDVALGNPNCKFILRRPRGETVSRATRGEGTDHVGAARSREFANQGRRSLPGRDEGPVRGRPGSGQQYAITR